MNYSRIQVIGYVFLLSLLSILGPLNIDMYLPSFPLIQDDLSTNAMYVQMSLTSCLLGLSIGQLIFGPLSDAVGRKRPLIISLIGFTIFSFICAFSPNIVLLIFFRFMQGFFASCGIVLSKAIARDLFDGRALTKFFTILMVITSVAPLIAPLLGGFILSIPDSTWGMIFYALTGLGVVITLISTWKLKESLTKEYRIPTNFKSTVNSLVELLKEREFLGYVLAVGFIHGGSFAYVSGTPFVYQELYGVTPQMFSLLFGINGVAIVLGSFLFGKLSDFFSEWRVLKWFIISSMFTSLAILISAIIMGPLFIMVISIFTYMMSIGCVLTGTFTLGMRGKYHNAGSASAHLGTLPLIFGAIATPMSGLIEGSAIPMGATICITAWIGSIFFLKLTTNPDVV